MEELYHFYTNELSMDRKIRDFKPKAIWYVIIGAIATIAADIISFFFIDEGRYALMILTLGLVSCIVLLQRYNEIGKKIMFEQHGVKVSGFLKFGGLDYYNYTNKKILEYLKSKNLLAEKKLKMLMDRSKRKSEEKSVKQFFVPGVFASLTIPTWNQAVISLFKNQTTTIDVFALLLTLFVFIIILTLLFSYYITSFRMIFGQKNERYKRLTEHLEDIYMNLSEHANTKIIL